MNTWRSISAICLGAAAIVATACKKDVAQESPAVVSPEQPEQTVIVPFDDSKTLPMPMPSVDMPPVTEEQRSRTKPNGTPGSEGGYQGKGNTSSN